MSDRFAEDAMEDLAFDEAEGAADAYEGEGDEFLRGLIGTVGRVAGGLLGGGGGGGDGFEEDGFEEDGFEEDGFEEDGFEEDGFEEDGFEEDGFEEDGFEESGAEDAFADALDAEDTDEFFRRFLNVARNVGRTVGQVARVVGPIASAIPIPQAQALGRVANVVGEVLADGGDEFDALDAVYDFAEEEDAIDAAAPAIATLALRTRMPAVARAPRQVRRQIVRGTTQATRTLARQRGPRAARAVPAVVGQVQQGVRRRAVHPRRVGTAVRRQAQRVARSPRATGAMVRQSQQHRRRHGRRHPYGHRRHGHRHHRHHQHHQHRGHMHGGRMGGAPVRGPGGAPVRAPGAVGPGVVSRPGGGHAACPVCSPARTYNLRGPVRITIQGR